MIKKRLTYFLPQRLHSEMLETIQNAGYSNREKSRWICEAIENLFQIPNHVELISFSDDMSALSKKDTLTIPDILKKELNEKTREIKARHLDMDGVQSRIIRTAILQRILRSSFSPGGKLAEAIEEQGV